MAEDPQNLDQLLDRFCSANIHEDRVRVEALIEEVGARSFGPMLLFAGVILASPLSGIPGVPTSMGVLVLLISLQLLVRRDHFWLPRWILQRSVPRSKLERSVGWLRRPARFVDRFLRKRLTFLVGGRGTFFIAAVCAAIALGVPFMEVVPFSATTAGVALTVFGLSLTARDGVLMLVALAITAGVVALLLYALL